MLADALSRCPLRDETADAVEIPEDNIISIFSLKKSKLSDQICANLSRLSADQMNDTFCGKVIRELSGPNCCDRIKKWFVVYKGVLFRYGSDLSPGFKVCVPEDQIGDIVLQEHEEGGHFGADKCFLQLSQWYYCPKMKKVCRKITSSCDLCQKSKISPSLHGPMLNVIPNSINQLVCLDLMRPLPRSRAGATMLLVVIDALSKYVSLYPLKKATTASVLRCLTERYFDEVGRPQVVLSDNGSQFTSRKWLSVLQDLGIGVRHTSVYFPQGNQTERINREIGRLLRSMCHEKHTRWAFCIKQVQGWLNRVVHTGTGMAPEFVHFGRKIENEFVAGVEFPESSAMFPGRDLIIELAHKRLLTRAQRRQLRFNDQHKLTEFKIGEEVLVRTHPQSSAQDGFIKKFFLLYDGPYTVVATRGSNWYELVNLETGENKGIQNIVNLKAYHRY